MTGVLNPCIKGLLSVIFWIENVEHLEVFIRNRDSKGKTCGHTHTQHIDTKGLSTGGCLCENLEKPHIRLLYA